VINTPTGSTKPAQVSSAPAGAPDAARLPVRILRRIGIQNIALIGALVLLSLIIRAFSDKVFLISNLLDIGVAVSILGILAVAQMVVIISGGLDISIGSTAGLSGVVVAMVLHAGVPTLPAILIALATGIAAGALNGALITMFSISPIIVTLATFSAFAGLALVLTQGIAVAVSNGFFDTIGTDAFLGVPYPVWLFLVFALLTHLYLRYTVVGRHVYAIGSNENAARNTGISLNRYRMGIYIYAGFAGSVAGVLGVARDALGQASSAGADQGLTAITAALLGGAALTGGRGSIPGAVLGVIILGLLDNGLVLVGADAFYSQIFIGALLVIAVGLQNLNLGRFRRRTKEAGE
jgi:ribose/xylose/arabinose/galactoside ABC-type transport system permease subunit